jgi:hypothetical protein
MKFALDSSIVQWRFVIFMSLCSHIIHFSKVLHILRNPGKMPRVYVTDYTSNSGLPPPPTELMNESWAKRLDMNILPIMLDFGQEAHVDLLQPGLIYRFNNVSMVVNYATDYKWMGRIGGQRRLFDQIRPGNASPELRALHE